MDFSLFGKFEYSLLNFMNSADLENSKVNEILIGKKEFDGGITSSVKKRE